MTTTTADAALVTAYLAGDRDALGRLYDRFAPSLYDTAAAMLSDRHEAADVVQDTFLVAAVRMGQLRDPERIKAWLFAIARHEIYRRTKRRRRFTAAEAVPEMVAPLDVEAEGESVAGEELAALVREAARGLDERDQLVLELSVRQGLQGADLAAALGVTPEQSYTLVHRMRERVERTIGALVVARKGRKDCPELAQVLLGWDGTFSVLWRKRVARHVDGCDTCERSRRRLAPLALIGTAPAFALPADLRDRVLANAGSPGTNAPDLQPGYRFLSEGGFPGGRRVGRRAILLAVGAIAVLVALIAGVIAAEELGDSDTNVAAVADGTPGDGDLTTVAATSGTTEAPAAAAPAGAAPTTVSPAPVAPTAPSTVAPSTVPPTTAAPTTAAPTTTPSTTTPSTTTTAPAPPGQLTLSSIVVDLGRSTTSAPLALTNTGGRPLDWSRGSASPFGITGPNGGTLAPGQSVQLTLSIDRAGLGEGSYSETLSIGGDDPVSVTLKARVERRPKVEIVAIDDTQSFTCQTSIISVQAAVSDESAIDAVTGTWSGPAGTGSFALVLNGGWYGTIVKPGGWGDGNGGTYQLTVTATDARGNQGSDTDRFTVEVCPQ